MGCGEPGCVTCEAYKPTKSEDLLLMHSKPTIKTLETLGGLKGHRPELEMAVEGDLSVEWAPFDFIQQGARLAIVGLTPGRTQAELAIQEMRRRLINGDNWETASEAAKRHASFGGAMRSNLLRLIDAIGLPERVGMPSAAAMFEPGQKQIHYTSVLRYPVFVNHKNYSGNPKILRTRLLTEFVESYFFKEFHELQDALWLPLGRPAIEVLEYAVNLGLVRRDRALFGLPHPSGANAERIAYFVGAKSAAACSAKTNPAKLDASKQTLMAQVAAL